MSKESPSKTTTNGTFTIPPKSDKSHNGATSGPSTSGRHAHASPIDRLNIFQYIFFTFTFPLFYKGYRNGGLSPADIHKCSRNDESHVVSERLKYYWTREVDRKGEKANFAWTMFRAFGGYYVWPLMIQLFEECVIRIVQPLLLGMVIRYFSGSLDIPREWALYSGGGVCLCSIIFITFHHPLMMQLGRLGMRQRVACSALMYEKALKLSRASLNQTAVGQIVNIMSNDMNRFDDFAFSSCYLITGPVQMCIIVYIVWQMLGISSIAGIVILGLLIPFQAFMGKCFSIVRSKTARLTDKRLKFMNEIISGMRVIKMYNWENPFAERIADARSKEVKQIRHSLFLKSVNICMFFVVSRTVLFACLFVYAMLNNVLTAEKVFVTMAMLNTLRLTMTLMFPAAITAAAELKISIKRIRTFLLLDELDESKLIRAGSEHRGVDAELKIEHISASYNPQLPVPTLNDISASLKPGDLLAVIGRVGSGKSAFIMSLLGGLPLTSGSISINGTLSYASQETWSFNDSIRQNILFGREFDSKRYSKIIEVCALERDLEIMPLGDRTLVGEKGVQLSGGQKARLNLARAVYRESDIYLLDDPLSAVDAGVAEHILEKCIIEHLKDKIRILVTHQIQFVEKATKILVLQDGACMAFGTFETLKEMGIDFMSLMEPDAKPTSGLEVDDPDADSLPYSRVRKESECSLEMSDMLLTSQPLSSKIPKTKSLSLSLSEKRKICEELKKNRKSPSSVRRSTSETGNEKIEEETSEPEETGSEDDDDDEKEVDETTPVIKVAEESRSSGAIGGHVYMEYFRAGATWFLMTTMLLFSFTSQAIFHFSDIFLAQWTNKNQEIERDLRIRHPEMFTGNDTTSGLHGIIRQEQETDSYIYAGIIGVLFVSTLVRAASFFTICNRASRRLHNQIFERILRAPLKFFDQNPVGRILNRFTKDLGLIDEALPYVAFDLNLIGAQFIGVIVTVSIVNWYLLIPSFFLMALIIFVRSIYIVSALDIKRIESMARSPIFSHVDITINGLSSIRAYGAQREFRNQFQAFQNTHSSCWFSFVATSRCMGMTMDWLSCFFIIAITLSVLFGDPHPGGDVGLIISSGLILAGMCQWGVRQSCEFESQMTSVERIVEYKSLEQEAPAKSLDPGLPPVDWPKSGAIEFQEMSLSYDEPGSLNKRVLKDITCDIRPGEKVGIVGRTGAGKSSTIGVLFRLTEPTGSVLIDGIDIQQIGLDDLRKNISIIPQDPVIFSGSVRYNLDPFDTYSDEQIWSALEKVQLKDAVSAFPARLSQPLAEGGANLSVGQKQLICLARAILRDNQILILDEATANVDYQTDNLIQTQLREQFAKCTVLTIAHRFNSIIDADRVLVLEAGRIEEFDTPYALLKAKGHFYKMCKRTGSEMFTHLYKVAKRTAKRRDRKREKKATSGTDEKITSGGDDEEEESQQKKSKEEGNSSSSLMTTSSSSSSSSSIISLSDTSSPANTSG